MVAALLLLGVSTVFAQNGSVTGRVVSSQTEEGLPAATVILQQVGVPESGPKIGRRTKDDGSFSFVEVPPGDYIVRVSYLGFKQYRYKLTVTASQATDISIKMLPDVRGMEDVVVTGEAQTRFKSDADVAVVKINAGELTQTANYQDLTQVIDGKAPGVKITPGSGTVGGGIRFDMRSGGGLNGSGQPAIFIDGVRVPNGELGDGVGLTGGQAFGALATLNPDDIADIQILKGPAAAALYGTSGSNGVVLIKTKNGPSAGMLGGGSMYQYKIISGWNEQATKYTQDMALTFDDANKTFRTGPFTEHELSIAGSNNLFNYYASFDHRNEDGIQYNNSQERNTLRANFSAFPSDKVKINTTMSYSLVDASLPQNDNNILGALGGTLIFGPKSVGGLGSYAGADSILGASISTTNSSHRFTGSVEGIYTPISDLTLRASMGYDGYAYRIEQMYPSSQDYSAFGVINGQRMLNNNYEDRTNLDFSAAYNWPVGEDIKTSTTLGSQLFYESSQSFFITKQNFPTDIVTNLSAGAKFISADEGLAASRSAGLYLLQDFSLQDKYLLSLGVRNEYASSIGTAAPSIFYPRASGAIRLDKLDFLPTELNIAKFRVAYGQSGILPGPLQASGLRWGSTPSGDGPGAVIVSIGNDAIQPERIGELELGLDLEYKNLYGLEFTYYMQNATNSIVNFTNGPSTGLTASATPRNVGTIEGSGVEATLYGQLFHTPDYQLDLSLIWNYGKNKVTSLGGAPEIYSGENAIAVGQPRSAFYTFAVRKASFNTDGTYAGPSTDTVRSYLGNPVAPTSGSFTINFRFLKNFTLNVLTDWQMGGTIHNLTRQFQTYYGNDKEYNTLIRELGLQGNPGFIFPSVRGDTTIKALTPGSAEYNAAADRLAQLDPNSPGAVGYFESSDYVRLREVSLRYDFGDVLGDVLPGRQVKSLAVSVGVRNLAWISKAYRMPDVELSTQGSTYTVYRGQDFLTLQNPRVFYFTATLGF